MTRRADERGKQRALVPLGGAEGNVLVHSARPFAPTTGFSLPADVLRVTSRLGLVVSRFRVDGPRRRRPGGLRRSTCSPARRVPSDPDLLPDARLRVRCRGRPCRKLSESGPGARDHRFEGRSGAALEAIVRAPGPGQRFLHGVLGIERGAEHPVAESGQLGAGALGVSTSSTVGRDVGGEVPIDSNLLTARPSRDVTRHVRRQTEPLWVRQMARRQTSARFPPRHRAAQGPLLVAFVLLAVFMLVEVVAGLSTNSLALISDAGHMLTDVSASAWPWPRSSSPAAATVDRHRLRPVPPGDPRRPGELLCSSASPLRRSSRRPGGSATHRTSITS